MDHHCPFLSNCIGKHNYTSFIWFINLLLLNIVYVLYGSVLICTSPRKPQFKTAFLEVLESDPGWYGVLFFGLGPLSLIAFFGVGFLVVYHWVLVIARDSTTYENIKQSFSKYYQNPIASAKKTKRRHFCASAKKY